MQTIPVFFQLSTVVFLPIWQEEYMNLETLNQRMQALVGVSKSDAAGYYGVPEGRLPDPYDLPCFPDDGSSTPLLADMGVLPNLPFSYGGSNLDANTRSSSNYFPLKHANNGMFKLDCDFSPIFNPYSCNIDLVFAYYRLCASFFARIIFIFNKCIALPI